MSKGTWWRKNGS